MAEFGVFCAASRWFSTASPLKPQMQCHSKLQFPDSRPRACSHRSLFVRRTPTRPRAKGQEPYFTHRLVRCGSKVRQRTLRNLGRHFALAREDWPALCARIERILAPPSGPSSSGPAAPRSRDEAQRSAAQLVQAGVSPVGPAAPADGADDPSAVPARGAGPVRCAARRRPRQPRRPHGRAGLRARRVALAATAKPWAGTPCSAPATACCATATRSRRVSSSAPPTCSTCSPPSPCTTGPARASRARRTGSRWPAAAIPGRSATTVHRSRWAWRWTPAASRAAPGSWPATSPRAARCRPC